MRETAPVALGFPLGRGRVAVVGGDAIFANEAVRTCQWGADLVIARVWEYVRQRDRRPDDGVRRIPSRIRHARRQRHRDHARICRARRRDAFSRSAARGGLLLLFAVAPRPIIPREPGAHHATVAARARRRARPRVFRRARDAHRDVAPGERSAPARRREPSPPTAADDRVFLDAVAPTLSVARDRRSRYCGAGCESRLRRASSRASAKPSTRSSEQLADAATSSQSMSISIQEGSEHHAPRARRRRHARRRAGRGDRGRARRVPRARARADRRRAGHGEDAARARDRAAR